MEESSGSDDNNEEDMFEELVGYCSSFNFDEMDTYELNLVPFVVLLQYAINKWCQNHENQFL